MKLQKLEIKNLYGFMNKSIDFSKQLNLLVGINGSGKTSILNVISWIMQPSFTDLCTTEFEQLTLVFSHEEKKHTILCKQSEKALEIKVTVNRKPLPILKVNLRIPASVTSSNVTFKEAFIPSYENIQPQQHEIETWMYFSNLPNPIIISIDRKFEQKTEKIAEQKFKPRVANTYSSSLEMVKKYSTESHARYNKKVIDLNKTLRDKILLSSFESSVIDMQDSNRVNNKLSVKDVDKLEINITKFLADDTTDKEMGFVLRRAVRKYAAEMRTIINDYFNMREGHRTDTVVLEENGTRRIASVATNYFVNSNQFTRIQKLLIAFSRYEEDSSQAYKSIDVYLKSINHFLKDSSKELLFRKENGQLYFNLKDKNNNVFKSEQNIDGLSSGEKQILILFTYLAFGDTKGKIFIIDEPEISLHPKWQDDFLQQLNNVTPPDTQLIIATHSPSIVGDLEDNCKILLPYNE